MEGPRIEDLTPGAKTLGALLALERACFSVPWRETDFEQALQSDLYRVFGCYEGETLVGFTVFFTIYEVCELMNLAVAPDARRAGIGGALLRTCLEQASEAGAERVLLEVREHNAPAIALYEKSGFRRFGRRRNYYRLPVEDALLYFKDIQRTKSEKDTSSC